MLSLFRIRSATGRGLFAIFAALAALTAGAAPPTVTLLEGDATVIHGKGSFAALEGLRLPGAALVQTASAARLVRFEWADGTSLDLGPATMVVLLGERMDPRQAKAPGIFLVRGWAKVSTTAATGTPVVQTPAIQLAPFAGVVVLQIQGDRHAVFVERGNVQLQERTAKAPVVLPAGQFYGRQGNATGDVQPRPPAELLTQLPRAFRDTLPRRLAAVQGREVNPKPLPLPPYPELREWLVSDATLRRLLVTHFAVWAQDPGIRSGLVTRINDHREWAPLVLPKPDPARTGGASNSASATR